MCGLHLTRNSYLVEREKRTENQQEEAYKLSDINDYELMPVEDNAAMSRLQEIIKNEINKTPDANTSSKAVQIQGAHSTSLASSTRIVPERIKQRKSIFSATKRQKQAQQVTKSAPRKRRPFKRPPVLEFDPLYKKAVDLYYKQHYVEAIKEFRTLLQFNQQHPLASQCQHWIGDAYFAMGAYFEAVIEYEKVAMFPGSSKAPEAMLMVGISLFRTGETSLAQQEFKRVLESQEKKSVMITAQRYLRKISRA